MKITQDTLKLFNTESAALKKQLKQQQRELNTLYTEEQKTNLDSFFYNKRLEPLALNYSGKRKTLMDKADNLRLRARHLHLAYSLAKKMGLIKAQAYFMYNENDEECFSIIEKFKFERNPKTKPNLAYIEAFFYTMENDFINKRSSK